MSPRVLTIDIETSPNIADVWGLWNQNVSLNQLRESTRVICFAAKWEDHAKIIFASEFHDGRDTMIGKAWDLLDEADILVHYNGKSFDVPHLQREFLLAGASPPGPFQQVDLLRAVRSQFRFSSNKLDHIVQQLGLGQKTHHEGHDLWVKCLAGDAKAWARMRAYCKHDVELTEQLYKRLTAWTPQHPNRGLFTPGDVCGRCGSTDLRPRGFAYTSVSSYQRFRCGSCGGWSRGKHAVDRTETRSV